MTGGTNRGNLDSGLGVSNVSWHHQWVSMSVQPFWNSSEVRGSACVSLSLGQRVEERAGARVGGPRSSAVESEVCSVWDRTPCPTRRPLTGTLLTGAERRTEGVELRLDEVPFSPRPVERVLGLARTSTLPEFRRSFAPTEQIQSMFIGETKIVVVRTKQVPFEKGSEGTLR